VRGVLGYLKENQVAFDKFLDAFSWGNEDCIQDPTIRNTRTRFMHSPKLPAILKRWAKPHQSTSYKKKRPKGASTAVTAFALEYVKDLLDKKMEDLAPSMSSP
ncbi:hypothetical protein CPB83DRAFT_734955, partial [Crepidotus variabilis]